MSPLRRSGVAASIAAALAFAVTAQADSLDGEVAGLTVVPEPLPAMALIIDDIGHRAVEGMRAVELPGPVAFAVLPHTPHGPRLARLAHGEGKEILLHMPMQPVVPHRALGEGAIMLHSSRGQLRETLVAALRDVPYVVGLNNHMGSLVTRHPGHMDWLMEELGRERLFFVDSVTSGASVAAAIAREHRIPTARRDIFLDREADEVAIQRQLERLKALARQRGHALGIGHPYPDTIRVLERELPRLAAQGFRLVSVSELIALRNATRR